MNGLIQLDPMLAKKRRDRIKDCVRAIEVGVARMRNQEVRRRG